LSIVLVSHESSGTSAIGRARPEVLQWPPEICVALYASVPLDQSDEVIGDRDAEADPHANLARFDAGQVRAETRESGRARLGRRSGELAVRGRANHRVLRATIQRDRAERDSCSDPTVHTRRTARHSRFAHRERNCEHCCVPRPSDRTGAPAGERAAAVASRAPMRRARADRARVGGRRLRASTRVSRP